MPSRLTKALLREVAEELLQHHRVLFLCKDVAQADRLAMRLRKAVIDEAIAEGMAEVTARIHLMRPPGSNPSFVQLAKGGGWCFLHPCADITADEDIGAVELVYWPTEGGNYEKVDYRAWKTE